MAGVRTVLRFIARSGKRVAVALVGFALLTAGTVMLVTPGPGLLVIIAGLAVLATEFTWAQTVLERTKQRARSAARKAAERSGFRRAKGGADPDSPMGIAEPPPRKPDPPGEASMPD